MNLHELISEEFSEEGQQTSHHHHKKSKKVVASLLERRGAERAGKEGSSLPYRDWPGQTVGSIEELAIGMVVRSFCLLVISACKPGLSPRVRGW